jgi:NNP family nitrate/nitrite transporter-like MFS transporter
MAPLLIGTMIMLGLGNGVVFQLVPQRFPAVVGIVTGIVGAVGGVGGFLLPAVLGAARQMTGSYTAGLATMGGAAAMAALSLAALRRTARVRAGLWDELARIEPSIGESVQQAG